MAADVDGDGFDAGDCAPLDPAVHPGAGDRPDLAFEDLDCDGIDGTAATALFVSAAGNDAGDGSLAQPLRTIQAAIDRAAAPGGARDVYVQGGTYGEHVVLRSGVSVFGGYTPAGARSTAPASTILAPAGAESILADGAQAVELQLLSVMGPDAVAPGASSYAIRALAGSRLALTGVTARGGRGASGTAGAPGAVGAPGNAGLCGGFAILPNQTLTCLALSGGPGGTGAAGGSGGSGANSPPGTGAPVVAGATGNPGAGAAGGAGAPPGPRSSTTECVTGRFCGDAGDGQTAQAPAEGAPGGGAAFTASAAGAAWVNGSTALPGQAAAPGGGGGGGGSGATFDDVGCAVDSLGGPGGGGGGGGGPGAAGAPGTSAGGSFAVYLHASSAVIDGGMLTGGVGGAGGRGGQGGAGGAGGLGGRGAGGFSSGGGPACDGISGGEGGSGGAGAPGGRGGGGGGGAGGPSVGLFAAGASSFALKRDASTAGGDGGSGGQQGNTTAASGVAGAAAGTLAQAGANAVAADFDGDGVADAADACPTVPAATADGCVPRPSRVSEAPPAPAAAPAPTPAPAPARRRSRPGPVAGSGCVPTATREIPGNAADEDCDGRAAPLRRIRATVLTSVRAAARVSTFSRLTILSVPSGARVQLRCSGPTGACGFSRRTLRIRGGAADGMTAARPGRGLTVGRGATLEIRVTARGSIGMVVQLRIRGGRLPVRTQLCLPPGSSRPRAC